MEGRRHLQALAPPPTPFEEPAPRGSVAASVRRRWRAPPYAVRRPDSGCSGRSPGRPFPAAVDGSSAGTEKSKAGAGAPRVPLLVLSPHRRCGPRTPPLMVVEGGRRHRWRPCTGRLVREAGSRAGVPRRRRGVGWRGIHCRQSPSGKARNPVPNSKKRNLLGLILTR